MHLKYLVNLGHDEPQDKLVAQVECSLVTNSSKSGVVILFLIHSGSKMDLWLGVIFPLVAPIGYVHDLGSSSCTYDIRKYVIH